MCFSLWVVVKPSSGRNSPCTPIRPSSAATPQGPRLRSLDLAPVSPAAGRGFLLAQRLRQASTKLGGDLFPGLMAAGWLQSYQIHSSSVDRDPSSVIAREDSQTAIRRGGTGREIRTLGL